jgi:hypothetical protein
MSLSKWWKLKRGKRQCRYCPNTWLEGFYENGNCMVCPKCTTCYVHAWKPKSRWPKKWKPGYGSIGDPEILQSIHLYFHRTRDGLRKECIVKINVIDKTTHIILDFGKWTFSNPTLVLPYIIESLTPFNVGEKIKKLMIFL